MGGEIQYWFRSTKVNNNGLCRIRSEYFSSYYYAILFIRSSDNRVIHIQRMDVISDRSFGSEFYIKISKRLVSFIKSADPFLLYDISRFCIFSFVKQLTYMPKIRCYIYILWCFRFPTIESVFIKLYSFFLGFSKNHGSKTSIAYR